MCLSLSMGFSFHIHSWGQWGTVRLGGGGGGGLGSRTHKTFRSRDGIINQATMVNLQEPQDHKPKEPTIADPLEGSSTSHSIQTLKPGLRTPLVPNTPRLPTLASHQRRDANQLQTDGWKRARLVSQHLPIKNWTLLESEVEPRKKSPDVYFKKAQLSHDSCWAKLSACPWSCPSADSASPCYLNSGLGFGFA